MTAFTTPSNATTANLADLRWEHRLIIAFSSENTDENDALLQWVSANSCELQEREVIVFLISESKSQDLTKSSIELEEESVAALEKNRQSAPGTLELVLVGKDGGIKANAHSVDKLDEMLIQIDGMPMRRQEARQNSQC